MTRVAWLWAASALLLAGAALPAKRAEAATAIAASAPAGFERLEGEQTALVDVYFGGRRLLTTLARFHPGAIRFLDPEAVLRSAPHLKSTPELAAALAADLESHSAKVCYPGAPEGCGRLEPALAGVIFDEARFRADLFINPSLIDMTPHVARSYLPAPEARFSAVSTLGGTLSGDDRGHAEYGLHDRMIMALGAARLVSDISASSGAGPQVDTLAMQAEIGRLRYQGGILAAPAMDFFGQARVLGASIGTQVDTLADRDALSATPVVVFLQDRARVDIYGFGRLCATHSYDAGPQLIDTSSLPDGAYQIILKISEASGAVRQETRFFTRTRSVPPLGRPLLQLTAGALLPDDGLGRRPASSSSFVQATGAWRVAQALAIDAMLAADGRQQDAGLGLTWLARGLRARADALAGTGGDYGVSLNAIAESRFGVLSLDMRQAWGRRTVAGCVRCGGTGMAISAPEVSTYGFIGAGRQAVVSFTPLWRDSQLTLRAAYSAVEGGRSTYSAGATYEHSLGAGWRRNLHAYASFAETSQGAVGFAGLRFALSQGRRSVIGEAGYVAQPREIGGGGATLGVSASGGALTPAGEMASSVSYSRTPEASSAALGVSLEGPAGSVAADVQHGFQAQGGTTYAASFSTAAVWLGHGGGLASARSGESGVQVAVDGQPGMRFRLMVDDAEVGRVRAGQQLTVLLPAFRAYRVRLAPVDGGGEDFDTAERNVSLYPGNVVRLNWRVQQELEVFGRLVDARGLPLVNAAVAGAHLPSSTDTHGYFQTTVRPGEKLAVTTSAGTTCRIALPTSEVGRDFVRLGEVVCDSSPGHTQIARR